MVKKSSWSEHTWSTFILRAEEESEPILLGKQLLSQFQKDKFIHFFYHVLDLNMDHVISQVLTGTTQCKIVSKKVVFRRILTVSILESDITCNGTPITLITWPSMKFTNYSLIIFSSFQPSLSRRKRDLILEIHSLEWVSMMMWNPRPVSVLMSGWMFGVSSKLEVTVQSFMDYFM